MDDVPAPTDDLLQRAAGRLTGHQKRLFQAEVAVALCGGSARRAERRFGWGRDAVRTGLGELATGIRCVERFPARGRVRAEDADPQLAADIRALVEPRTHADPELKTDRRYTDLAAREVRERLRSDKGYAEADLPSERSMRDILNRLGYRLARVRKARPLRKTADTDAIFANVQAARAEAAGDPATLEISVDTRAKVAEGAYVRGGEKPGRRLTARPPRGGTTTGPRSGSGRPWGSWCWRPGRYPCSSDRGRRATCGPTGWPGGGAR